MRAVGSENTAHGRRHTFWITEGVYKWTAPCKYGGKRSTVHFFLLIRVINEWWLVILELSMSGTVVLCGTVAWLADCLDWLGVCPIVDVIEIHSPIRYKVVFNVCCYWWITGSFVCLLANLVQSKLTNFSREWHCCRPMNGRPACLWLVRRTFVGVKRECFVMGWKMAAVRRPQ